MAQKSEGETIRQRMASTRAEFDFGKSALDYKISEKRDEERASRITWGQFPPPSSYLREAELDVWLRWTLIVMPLLAVFALIRPGDPGVKIALYASLALVAAIAVRATRFLRRVSYVSIPTEKIPVVVLDDAKRDDILGRIAGKRRDAWLTRHGPKSNDTVRQRLSRLRWLAENEIISREELALEQRKLPTAVERAAAPFPDVSMVQRAFGRTMGFAFGPDSFVHTNDGWLGDRHEARFFYSRLRAPETAFSVERNSFFGVVGIMWTVAIAIACLSALNAAHEPNHYVGGTGLANAISDFGPIFAIGALMVWLFSKRSEIRFGRPYGYGLTILRDKRYDEILGEIERRRIAALKALAEPDPALTIGEQVETLDNLLDSGAITQEEYAEQVRRAEIVCGDPDLDRLADEAASRPAYALH